MIVGIHVKYPGGKFTPQRTKTLHFGTSEQDLNLFPFGGDMLVPWRVKILEPRSLHRPKRRERWHLQTYDPSVHLVAVARLVFQCRM